MMVQGLATGVILISPRGDRMSYVLQIHFFDSNKMVEYEALLHGLHVAASMGIRHLICHGDSDIAVQQVMKPFDTKDPKMGPTVWQSASSTGSLTASSCTM